jgi:hypothetical protein
MVLIEDIEGLGYDALLPDAVGSMFDEDIFIEIQGLVIADGEPFNMTIDSVAVSLIVWDGKARYYFDNFNFTSSTAAKITVVVSAPFDYTFDLIPKKAIGDVAYTPDTLLPFWSLKNVFSSMNEVKVNRIYNGVAYNTTHAPLTFVELNNMAGYYLGATAYYYNAARIPCASDVFFKWVDEYGLWRSWYFGLKETKVSAKNDSFNIIKNLDAGLNERTVKIDQKKNQISQIYSSGNEPREVLQILNSIKSSSYVYAYINDAFERVNVKSEDTTTYKLMDEFIFTVTKETKTAL